VYAPENEVVSMQRTSTSEYLTSFMVGGLIGAGVALLFAPRSGRETRELIGDRVRDGAARGRELKAELAEAGREVVDQASSFVERQRQSLQRQKDRVATAVDAGRDAYQEEKTHS
jgi:gas vesicle protein